MVAQLLVYYIALAKGLKDPDKPRNLAKSVTVNNTMKENCSYWWRNR